MAEFILGLAVTIAGVGMALGTYRLVRGPCAATRAVSLDLLTLISMPMLAGVALLSDRQVYLDVALVYGVLSFLGVLVLARYFERGI